MGVTTNDMFGYLHQADDGDDATSGSENDVIRSFTLSDPDVGDSFDVQVSRIPMRLQHSQPHGSCTKIPCTRPSFSAHAAAEASLHDVVSLDSLITAR